ncbi:PREDICTED: mucin-13-like, partial [Poecilia mexicana]|uniref:mucin-13-like n=1 Tax=Poecilia mexicana TaxID=48701 RepID=UPI00072EDA58
MAGLRGLMILLVLMVGLAHCQEKNTITLPPRTGAGSSTPVATLPPLTGADPSTPVAISPPSTVAAPTAATSKLPPSNKPTPTSLSTTLKPSSSSIKTAVNTSHPSTQNDTSTNNQSTNQTTLPASISNENSTNNQSSNQPTTSPQPNTTMAATTAEPSTNQKCSYSVEKIKFGLKIKMTDSTPGYYTIYVAENEGSFERKGNFSFPSKNSTHEIKPLKPCTKYQLNVTFIDSNGTEIPCNKTEDKTKTTGMTEQEIKNISCSPGYFCYQSGWNISSLLSENNKVSIEDFNNGSYRFKHAYDEMCSDLVLEFPPENCSNVTFTVSEKFTV